MPIRTHPEPSQYADLSQQEIQTLFKAWRQAARLIGKKDMYVNVSIARYESQCKADPTALSTCIESTYGCFLSLCRKWRLTRNRLFKLGVMEYEEAKHQEFLLFLRETSELMRQGQLLYLDSEALSLASRDIEKYSEIKRRGNSRLENPLSG